MVLFPYLPAGGFHPAEEGYGKKQKMNRIYLYKTEKKGKFSALMGTASFFFFTRNKG